MKHPWRAALLAFLATNPLPALAQAEAAPSWYFGTFMGTVASAKGRTEIRLTCDRKDVCSYAFLRQPQASRRFQQKVIPNLAAVDPGAANKDLAHAREAVRRNPRAYSGEKDGPVLQQLRPLLESGAAFDACVGTGDRIDLWGRICRPAGQGGKLPAAVLLVPTLNEGACDQEVFCEYYLFPLHRIVTHRSRAAAR